MISQVTFFVDITDPSGGTTRHFTEKSARDEALVRDLDYFYRYEQIYVDEQLVHASWERVNV